MTRHPSSFLLHPYPARGFTLLEVMISVAIMLFLVIGINQVFSTTSKTIGAGQAASSLTRDQKAASTVFYSDWRGAATIDSPAIIIHSAARPAFLSKVDAASDGDANAMTIEQKGMAATNVGAFTYNYRNHRVDTFSFFSRGDFPRQTGNDGFLAADMSSNEAWIWYGQLQLPNNMTPAPSYYYPGEPDKAAPSDKNENNLYASQWVLGRVAMLLRTPDSSGLIVDDKYHNNQQYINFTAGTNLTPLAYGSAATSGGFQIQNSRYDLAKTSIDNFRARVIAAITADPTDWWRLMVYTLTSANAPTYRFQCDPYSVLDRTTTNAASFAKTTPYFLPGCTQFMVEYAGDFVTQYTDPADIANYGNVKTDSGGSAIIQPDGIVDFYVDKSADPSGTDSTKWVRQTRWFGLGRDLSGNGTAADVDDVRPFRDSWPTTPPVPQQNFEKEIIAPVGASPGVYTCVFGPTDVKPKMIRITVTVTDPNDRLANGQTYEYVLGSP